MFSARFAGLHQPPADADDALFAAVRAYTHQVVHLGDMAAFDVIHAHEWMSLPAAVALGEASGKPFVAHVHSTELDRAGTAADPRIMAIERSHIAAADAVIAVSHLTRACLVRHYGVDPRRITVVHSALPTDVGPAASGAATSPIGTIEPDDKVVLFAGRMTMQKGPEYFLAAARIVASREPHVRFVLAGDGDWTGRMMSLARRMGLSDRVTFAGFVDERDMPRLFRQADAFVMPSVSEPYGLAALEAVHADVPVLVSRQCGVREVLTHALFADFWDVHDIAGKIIAMLRYPPLAVAIRRRTACELRALTWATAAKRCRVIYDRVIGSGRRIAG